MQELKDVGEKVIKLGQDMKAMVDLARTEERDLTPEESAKFDAIDKDREELRKTEARLQRIAELEGSERRTQHQQPGREVRETPERKEAAGYDGVSLIRSWLQAGSDIPLTNEQRSEAKRAGFNPGNKVISVRMPSATLRGLDRESVRDWRERVQKENRALSTLTSTSPEDGSYLIADDVMQPLEEARLAFGGVRQVATVIRTNTGATFPIPTNDDTSNKGALLAENTIAVEKDPAFGQLVLGAFKWTSKKVLVSRELMQDSNENLATFMANLLATRIGRIENDYFTTGTGTNEPKGIVTAATSSGVALAAQTPTYAEMVSIEHTVDPSYRNGARWMFHDTLFAEVKKITDASTGRPIWLPSMVAGAPDTILGYPYTINQSMAVAAGSGSGKSILFGQLSKYIVRDVRDVVFIRLDELYAEYYQVAFVAFARSDGDLLDAGTHPVKYAANKA